jgi:hypothetical protein
MHSSFVVGIGNRAVGEPGLMDSGRAERQWP